ncbi:MAG: restriction endonuclease [Archaeoglobales archaeon]|nr:MAG: restriction endonuclease [Archaeoglobales archaeon]
MIKLTKELLINEARDFCIEMSKIEHENIRGVTDGKSIGDYFEKIFKARIAEKYETEIGSSATGIDFPSPEVNTDMKVTSIKQPQSSAPFQSFRQKVYGLGYNILLFVYEKDDSKEFNVQFLYARFIDKERTGDYITTKGLQRILKEGGNIDDIKAFILERIPYIDDIELEKLAKEVFENPPKLGYLTISQALQWRLQYSRVIYDELEGVIKIYG